MSKLGVNIDHVATLRNARGENHPNILKFADIAINSGADSITVHLREDRRHIKDLDLKKLCKKRIKINLEMACNNKMLKIALRNMPNYVCIVPEKRKEITTEGGIDLKKNFHNLKEIKEKNIKIYKIYFFLFASLFLVCLVFNAKSVIIYIPNKRMIIPIKYFIIFL